MFKKLNIAILVSLAVGFMPKDYDYTIAVLKYRGGGDWYANPSALTNLAQFVNQNLNARINPNYATVEAASHEIFNFPFVHMTGHGNVIFDQEEAKNLRLYLEAGGFLHIDDNYGMDKFIRPELKKIFPEKELEQLSAAHPVFHQNFKFEAGLPKIHEHDKKPPEAYAYRINGRIVLLYTHESDIGDGWEDQAVHNDPEEIRQKALRMGSNIIQYVFSGLNE